MGTEIGMEIKAKGTIEWQNDISQLQNSMPVAANPNTPGIANLENGRIQNSLLGQTTTTNDILQTISDNIKQVVQQFRAFNNDVPDGAKGANPSFFQRLFGGIGNGSVPPASTSLSKAFAMAGTGISMYEGYNSYQKSILSGNFIGADTGALRTVSGGLNTVGDSLLMASFLPGVGLPAAIIGGLLKTGSLITRGAASHKEVSDTQQNLMLQKEDVYNDLLKAYGVDTLSNDALSNANQGVNLYSQIAADNKGYGIEDAEYLTQVANLRSYGMDMDAARVASQKAGALSSYTNADFNTLASFEGLISKYGGNGANSLAQIASNAQAIGFNDMQFNELITSIESAMQNGISKGFLESTDDLLSLATGFVNASNNSEFWSGEAGMQRVSQVKAGVQGATELNSSMDMIIAQAVNSMDENEKKRIIEQQLGLQYSSDSALNNYLIMSSGIVTNGIYNSILSGVNNSMGSDFDKIKALEQLFGGNTILAAQALKNGSLENVNLNAIGDLGNMESMGTYTTDTENIVNRQSTTSGSTLNGLLETYGHMIERYDEATRGFGNYVEQFGGFVVGQTADLSNELANSDITLIVE